MGQALRLIKLRFIKAKTKQNFCLQISVNYMEKNNVNLLVLFLALSANYFRAVKFSLKKRRTPILHKIY